MELFVRAEQDYKDKKFQSAYRYYHRCLEREKTDEKTMLQCCEKIVHLSELMNIRREYPTEELLCRCFFRLSRHDCSVRHGETAIENKKSRDIYEILWESYFQEGNLLKAGEIAEDYLIYCKNKHLCDSGLDFIKKLEDLGLSTDDFFITALELEIIRGNKQFVLKKWEEGDGNIPVNRYQDSVHFCKNHWERESIVRKIFLKYWRKCLKSGQVLATDIVERKKIVYFALIDFLLGGDEFLEALEIYGKAFEEKDLLDSLERYKKKEGHSPHIEREDISLPLEMPSPEEFPDSTYPHKFSSTDLPEEHSRIYVDRLGDDFSRKNSDSLLVGLMEMQLYESALKLIDKMRDKTKEESVEYQINMAYIEVVLLKRAGKYYQAMDLIRDSLGFFPVKEKERKIFLKERDILMEKINLPKGKN